MEKAVLFGPERNLAGIFTLTEAPPAKSLPGVIILNAGLIHHVGPYRLHVDVARDLAAEGFPVLRFDFSGLGDSLQSRTVMSDTQRAIIECRAAMDTMTQVCGSTTFILMGLCSGADNSHTLAALDQRVCGMVSIDGYAYPTFLFRCKDYGPALVNPRKWVKHGMRFIGKLFGSSGPVSSRAAVTDPDLKIYEREFPPKKTVVRELQAVFDRGVKALFVFSGGIPMYYNYEKQFFHMYKSISFNGRVSHRYFPDTDHTFTNYNARLRLRNEIKNWVRENFGNNKS